MRVLTHNLWACRDDWPERRAVLVGGLGKLRPDLVAFQAAIVPAGYEMVTRQEASTGQRMPSRPGPAPGPSSG